MLYGLLGALIGLLICIAICDIITKPQYVVTTEELPEEEVKRITEARANIVGNFCNTVGDAWDIQPDNFDSHAELLPNEITLVTLIHKNNLIHIYVNWSKHMVHFALSRKEEKTTKIYKKSFDYHKENALEKVYKFLEKHKPAIQEKPSGEIREEVANRLTTVIENMIDQKVQEKLEKMLAELEEKEEAKDHE